MESQEKRMTEKGKVNGVHSDRIDQTREREQVPSNTKHNRGTIQNVTFDGTGIDSKSTWTFTCTMWLLWCLLHDELGGLEWRYS